MPVILEFVTSWARSLRFLGSVNVEYIGASVPEGSMGVSSHTASFVALYVSGLMTRCWMAGEEWNE